MSTFLFWAPRIAAIWGFLMFLGVLLWVWVMQDRRLESKLRPFPPMRRLRDADPCCRTQPVLYDQQAVERVVAMAEAILRDVAS